MGKVDKFPTRRCIGLFPLIYYLSVISYPAGYINVDLLLCIPNWWHACLKKLLDSANFSFPYYSITRPGVGFLNTLTWSNMYTCPDLSNEKKSYFVPKFWQEEKIRALSKPSAENNSITKLISANILSVHRYW